jgi:hypothetical protein
MKKIIIFMSICLLTLSTSLRAQEPTLQQTVDYIINRVTQVNEKTFGKTTDDWVETNFTYSDVLITFDQNKSTFQISYNNKDEVILKDGDILRGQYRFVYDLDIKRCNISIAKREDGVYQVKFKSKKQNEAITSFYRLDLDENKKREFTSGSTSLDITKDSDPEKVLKAFQHLQKLLGVKDDSDMF